MSVPAIRVTALNENPLRQDGAYVLYWMTANRRATHNFALDRAVELAAARGVPVVVLEALRVGYPWASDRLHAFVIQGMADNARAFAETPALYYPYVEPREDAGKGLVEALAAHAVAVVTDEFPCFFLPKMAAAAAKRIAVRMEQVDSNGLLPLRATDKAHATAYAFRRMLQKAVLPHLEEVPRSAPFEGFAPKRLAALPREIAARWPAAAPELLSGKGLAGLPIDHSVGAVGTAGGTGAARAVWNRFLTQHLARYGADRSHPDDNVASGLSPWLHFGHISVHELFDSLAEWQDWSPEKIGVRAAGQREGYWNMGPDADSFLDELITWRELGYGTCLFEPRYNEYGSLPAWARATLDKHRADKREWNYSLAQLEAAETHDEVWNAGQRELVRDGRMQNYLRMLWGKKILEWAPSPEHALETLIHLNNKYALDGRNPNSYSGIFWTLGRYDRPWAPERPVFGTIRWMSSANTVKKLRCKEYLRRFGPGSVR